MPDLEGPDELITQRRAAALSGLSLRIIQRHIYTGRLGATRLPDANEFLTTRRWLHVFLSTRPPSKDRKPLPADYRPPKGTTPPVAPPATLEAPDKWITPRRAAQLAGLSVRTTQSQITRGRLRAIQLPGGHEHLTTRRWLHEYLLARPARSRRKALPAGYVAPE